MPFKDPQRVSEINRVLDLIEAGGSFPYEEDGGTWDNREERLPEGTYREYTIKTPGATHRAKRRIVQEINTGATYYTEDHYKTFVQIDPKKG